jgi:twitching motility protein PilU
LIAYEDALRNADSKNELRLRVKLDSKREHKVFDHGDLSLLEEEEGRTR